MSATTVFASPAGTSSGPHAIRYCLIALAVVLLIVGSFALGRVTVSPATRVRVVRTTAIAPSVPPACRMNRPC